MLSRSGICRQIQALAGMALASIAVSVFDTGCLANPAESAQPAELEIGSSHSAGLKADQRLEFQVMLEAGRAYLIEIDQGGLDVIVELRTETGETERFDFPTARNDIELFLVEPGATGGYGLSVYANEYTGAVAHPRITIRQVEPENALLPAYRLLTDSAASNKNGQWRDALESLKQAAPVLERASATALLARCRLGAATLLAWQEFDYGPAMEWARQAEESYLAAGDERRAAAALELRGLVMVEQAYEIEKTPSLGLAPEARDQFESALSLLHRALETRSRLELPYETALSKNMIGYAHHMMGEYDTAVEWYEQAADGFHDLDEWQIEAGMPLNNIGVVEFDRGYLIRSIEVFSRTLDLLPPDHATHDRANLLGNLGSAHAALGELDQALEYHSAALKLSREGNDLAGQGHSLNGLGMTYMELGETELGVEYLEAALPLRREAGDGQGIVTTLNNLGRHYRESGDLAASLAAHREAQLAVTRPRDLARTLLFQVETLIAMGERDSALQILAQADEVTRKLQTRILRAKYLRLTGDAFLSASRFTDALASYEKAEALYADLGLAIDRASCLHGMSRSLAGLNHMDRAVEQAARAVGETEAQRGRLSTPKLRAFFMSERQDYYTQLITLLIGRGEADEVQLAENLELALNYSERSRARSLADLVNEARLVQGDGEQADDERRVLYKELADARQRLSLDQPDTAQRQSDITATKRQMADIENRLNLLEIELRKSNPAYSDLTEPDILATAGIQELLEDGTALLQYVLGGETGFVFLVTGDSVRAWPLPEKAQIEDQARDLYRQLSVPSSSRQRLNTQIATLSEAVLPSAEALNYDRLLVVADGVVQYLPFSVLLARGSDSPLENHAVPQVVNVPSMSVVAAQRSGRLGREKPARTIAIYADPVFTKNDPRLSRPGDGAGAGGAPGATRLSVPLGEPGDLERLPATRYEADTIARLVDPGLRMVRTGFSANRGSLQDAGLSDFRIVHFATHGKIDSRYPDLSWLALSQLDETGAKREGLLRLHDVYTLKLNAELVTMSACDTALGREIRGEGLTGLVQGFMYSGARSVLASLWQVPDRATAGLMEMFYRNLLERGQNPAEALRNAQLELSSQSRFGHPYFWSAFVLQGDWK